MDIKLDSKYEPYIKPSTTDMDVGGMIIPPTSLLTALLFGFANHDLMRAKEYYFWRVCDILWNRPDIPEPLMQQNPWAKLIIRSCLENKFLAVGGAASSSKSHTMAAYAIVNCLSQPKDTLVLITSTTLREARKRIWGSIITLLAVIEDMPFRIRDSIGNVAYVNAQGTLLEKSGLSLIAAEKSRTREAVGKFIGIKNKRVIVIGDELSEISEAVVHAGLTNLSANPEFRMIGMSNPSSKFDAFGVWSEPEDGWDSVDTNVDDGWRTKWGGKYIRLDGERSPNILAGETIYPYLPRADQIAEKRVLLGTESRGYMRMVRAVFFDSDEDTGIYSENEITKSGCMHKVKWGSKPIKVAGLDPAFTNGGDRTILYTGYVGTDDAGQYVFELGKSFQLNDDATNKAVPRSYQIVQQIKKICEKEGVAPDDLAVDATGAGSSFCDVLAGEWSPRFLRVTFGGKPSDKRVSVNSQLTGIELYTNRVSELWFVGKELMRTRQLFGLDSDLAQEIVGRNYELVKTGSLKVRIESKPEFKQRIGRSPDLADAAFLALDCARQRHGLIAMEPKIVDPNQSYRRPPKTMAHLKSALQNDAAYLP